MLIHDIETMLQDCDSTNIVPYRLLQSLTGKLSNPTRLLTVWRPFLPKLWAAIAG